MKFNFTWFKGAPLSNVASLLICILSLYVLMTGCSTVTFTTGEPIQTQLQRIDHRYNHREISREEHQSLRRVLERERRFLGHSY